MIIPSIAHRAPYTFDPPLNQEEAHRVIDFFETTFAAIAHRRFTKHETIMIFHDWWFVPYGRDMVANAETICVLAQHAHERFLSEHTLPPYFLKAQVFAESSTFAFYNYAIKDVMFNGQFQIQSAAA